MTEVTIGGGLSIDEIIGTYSQMLTNNKGDTEEGSGIFSKNESGQLVQDETVYNYDPATGTATFILEQKSGSATITQIFTSKNDTISYSGTMVVVGKYGTGTIYMEGTKVD